MKLLQISDTHIKNNSHHEAYKAIFEQLYKVAKDENVDAIIHCGDLCHTKTSISPEYVELASNFLKNLADIAPLFLIAGNHDKNLRNTERMDSIEPIVNALSHKNIFYLKRSGEYKFSENITFNALCISDNLNWVAPTNKSSINIALYHGAISGCKTDTGWVMKETDDKISVFNDFDYAMLGDIHLQQQLDKDGRIRYAGSTIQQNFGENVEKGVLIWDIKSKEDFAVKSINFINPTPFITIQSDEDFEKEIPKNAFLRVILDEYKTKDQIQELRNFLTEELSPRSIVFLENKADHTGEFEDVSFSKKLDLRDSNVQQELIKEFLSDEKIDEQLLQKILELNTKYDLSAEIVDDVARNVQWSLESFEWDNLFNYKEGNKIDFGSLSGIVGVFGKNYSGKSSLIDSLLYALFNSTSKKIRKNFDVVNERKINGSGSVELRVDKGVFKVSRETEKISKKSKGKIVEEGKTSVNFGIKMEGTDIFSLNGNDRLETDKNIKKNIGSFEDFCNTSLSTQHGSLDFINEGSTKRKEILANFLDLQIFERKYKPANQDANELKALIKKLQTKDYVKFLLEANVDHNKHSESLREKLLEIGFYKKELEDKRRELVELNTNLSKVEVAIDFSDLSLQEKKMKAQHQVLKQNISDKEKTIKEAKEFLEKCQQVIDKLDIKELKEKREISNNLAKEINAILSDKKSKTEKLSFHRKNSLNLELAACGTSSFNDCVFKKSALESVAEIDIIELLIDNLNNDQKLKALEFEKIDSNKILEYIDKYEKLKEKYGQANNKILTEQKEISDHNNAITKLENLLKMNGVFIETYHSNKELYDNISFLQTRKVILESDIRNINSEITISEKKKDDVLRIVAATEQMIETYKKESEELFMLNKEYSAYELFLKCCHSNGIPFELIKSSLPLINEEMNKLLSNIVEFEAFFENEDGKLEIYIKHPNSKERSIENCSGAEKSLVAMAIRLALIKCGSLPVSDVFILDEPATALDAEHMSSFVKVLEMIKSEFRVVLLITHLDALKDSVDKILEIQKDDDGFAYIN